MTPELTAIRDRPGMYVMEETYVAVSSLITGYDLAQGRAFLKGFREWLVVEKGCPPNLAWPVSVVHVAFPEEEDPRSSLGVKNIAVERRAISVLFEMIDEFCQARDSGRLDAILIRYMQGYSFNEDNKR